MSRSLLTARLTCLFLFVMITFTPSCKKGDTGPQGAQGPAGPQGPQGIQGNSNVTQYDFGAQNLQTGFVQLQIATTEDTMNRSTWLVYLYYQPLTRWYFLPGPGTGGATQYRVSMGYSSNKVNIYIDKNGPGEQYTKARVVRIYNNNVITNGMRSSYEAVRTYYGLPE
ncbi:MAG: collagen-like protein [Chitinophagaceae bacterium]|nr:collagen-like protein [Chitinophagaceae bacterium]